MFKFASAAAVFAAAAVLSAPVHAQETAPDTGSSELTADDVITFSIGCIATYDTVLAQGKGGDKAEDIKAAREVAVLIYKEFSGESDAEAAESIRMAGAIFPTMLAEGGELSLDDYRSACDAIFMDDEMAATVNTPAT